MILLVVNINLDIMNFSDKTDSELKFLINRYTILLKSKFKSKLPDNGSKIQNALEKSKMELKKRESLNETSKMLNDLSISPNNIPMSGILLNEKMLEVFSSVSALKINKKCYNRIVQMGDCRKLPPKFHPNRCNKLKTLIEPDIHLENEIDNNKKEMKDNPEDVLKKNNDCKNRYDENLRYKKHNESMKYEKTKFLSLEDSIVLLTQKNKELQDLQMKHAISLLTKNASFQSEGLESKPEDLFPPTDNLIGYRKKVDDCNKSDDNDSDDNY